MATRGRPRQFDRIDALDKALVLFWERGYENTSMSDLSNAMELRPPSIYAAFGSKEALFEEVVERYSEVYGGAIWGDLERFKHPRDATRHILIATVNAFCDETTPKGCLIVLAAPQTESSQSNVTQTLCTHRQKNVETLKHLYEEGLRRDHIPRGANINVMANYYATVQHGMSIQARDGMNRAALTAVAEAAMATWPTLIKTSLSST